MFGKSVFPIKLICDRPPKPFKGSTNEPDENDLQSYRVGSTASLNVLFDYEYKYSFC